MVQVRVFLTPEIVDATKLLEPSVLKSAIYSFLRGGANIRLVLD